jgi:hypothetical protein
MLMVKRYVVYAANCICDAPPNSDGQYVLVADYDALAARLAEADALIAKGLAVVHDFLPNIGRCVLQDYQRMNEFCSEAAARTAVSAVQPERCCLDYPRCDCNSPPEPDSASGERDATYAQLAEAQRFPHGAAAVTGCDMKINDEGRSNAAHWYERAMKAEARLQKVMARCADLLDEDQFNELDAMTRTTETVSAGQEPK